MELSSRDLAYVESMKRLVLQSFVHVEMSLDAAEKFWAERAVVSAAAYEILCRIREIRFEATLLSEHSREILTLGDDGADTKSAP